MSSHDAEDAWDFTSVIDLHRSLSYRQESRDVNGSLSSPSSEDVITPVLNVEHEGGGELGNFDKIWEFLGQPSDLPPPIVPPLPDDATYELTLGSCDPSQSLLELSIGKGVRWRDEVGEVDIADEFEDRVACNAPQPSKARREKLRKQRQTANRKRHGEAYPAYNTSSSELDFEPDNQISTPLQNRSAIIQQLINEMTTKQSTESTNEGKPPTIISTSKSVLGSHDLFEAVAAKHRYPTRSTLISSETSIRNITSKRNRLISRLINRFVNDRQYINKLSSISFTETTHNSTDSGLHVFVDASNVRPAPLNVETVHLIQ